jgi:hypothetical protein
MTDDAKTKFKSSIAQGQKLTPPVPIVRYEDQLVDRQLAARWLGITPDCLSVWGRKGRGPRVLRVGQFKVRYKIGEILRWLDSQADAPEIPGKRRRQRAERQQRSA